jgi:uncharacterized protein (UPF0303 family)
MNYKNDNRKPINAWIDKEDWEVLTKYADTDCCSIAAIVRKAVKKYVEERGEV